MGVNNGGPGHLSKGGDGKRSGPEWALIEAVVENLPDMVFVKEATDLSFVYLNRKAEEIIGHSRADLLGKRDADFFPPEQAEFFTAKDRAVLLQQGVVEIPAEPIDTPDGTRFLHTKKITLFDTDGTPVYLLGISEDITEQHQQELERTRRRNDAVNRISSALEAGSISMAFQPIIDLRDQHVVGVEAIARFAERPHRTPDAWFDEATMIGRGVELELLAIESALLQLEKLPDDMFMSVNASPSVFAEDRFAELLRSVDTKRIVVELSEHSSVGDYGTLNDNFKSLRSEGVRLAVDDAGAGYASMQHIIEMHPDIIKADIGLIRSIDNDPARRAIVMALLGLRQDIEAEVVAEGIETDGERQTLMDLGCNFGQGFLLGRPGPLPLDLSVAGILSH